MGGETRGYILFPPIHNRNVGERKFVCGVSYVCMVADGSEHAPAGWYDDPHQPGRMRYFDGETWSNHFHEPGKLPDVGTWLNTTFSALAAHWQGAMGLAFVTAFVGNLITWLVFRSVFADVAVINDELVNFNSSAVPLLLLAVIVNVLLQGLIWLSLSRYMQRAHFQANPTVGEALAHGLRRLPRFVGALLLIFAAVVGIVFIVVVLGLVTPALAVLAIFGLIVGGVWAVVKLAFIAPAAVAAPTSHSIIRTSAAVSTDRFWPILGRILMFALVLPLAANVVTAVFGKYGSVIDTQIVAEMFDTTNASQVFVDTQLRDLFPGPGTFFVAAVVSSLIGAVTTLISVSAVMRLYLDSGAPSDLSAG